MKDGQLVESSSDDSDDIDQGHRPSGQKKLNRKAEDDDSEYEDVSDSDDEKDDKYPGVRRNT